ncbi:hypothetical protein SCAR479_08974 [Seiridium cardinale]|uniref:Uncharacterized protein n=1 Tax=Seiridium cardinale TaxID=138064 RepID=A0ABR2XL04_9PEZI
MTGFKYLSDAETLFNSKRQPSKPARGSQTPETPAPKASEAEHMKRIIDSYKELEEEPSHPTQPQVERGESSKTPSMQSRTGKGESSTPTAPQEQTENTPQFTTPLAQEQIVVREASRRRARDARLPVQTVNRLSAIMEADVPKSTQRTVTMPLSEVPVNFLSPGAQIMAAEEPERLITFQVSLHPVLDVVGMSASQALHNGIALPVESPITPQVITALDKRSSRAADETPTNMPRWKDFAHRASRLKKDAAESSTASLEVLQESRRPSKSVHFSNQDDVFHITPAHSNSSKDSVGTDEQFKSVPSGRVEQPESSLQRADSTCLLRRTTTVKKRRGPGEDEAKTPLLPELNFDRSSSDFGSLFDMFQDDLRSVVADMPGLPGVSSRDASPDKGRRADLGMVVDDNDDEVDVDCDDIPDTLPAYIKGKEKAVPEDYEPILPRPDSPTLGIGERDVVIRPAPLVLGPPASRVIHPRPALPGIGRYLPPPGPPPTAPLPAVPARPRPAFAALALQRPQQQRQQGSGELSHPALALPRESRALLPKSFTEGSGADYSSSSFTRSSKIRGDQLVDLSQGSSASSTARSSGRDATPSFSSRTRSATLSSDRFSSSLNKSATLPSDYFSSSLDNYGRQRSASSPRILSAPSFLESNLEENKSAVDKESRSLHASKKLPAHTRGDSRVEAPNPSAHHPLPRHPSARAPADLDPATASLFPAPLNLTRKSHETLNRSSAQSFSTSRNSDTSNPHQDAADLSGTPIRRVNSVGDFRPSVTRRSSSVGATATLPAFSSSALRLHSSNVPRRPSHRHSQTPARLHLRSFSSSTRLPFVEECEEADSDKDIPGTQETPSGRQPGSRLDIISNQLNHMLSKEIDKLYHKLPADKKTATTAESSVARLGETRSRATLNRGPVALQHPRIARSVSDTFVSTTAPVPSDHTRDQGSKPSDAEMGCCISKPVKDESPPCDNDALQHPQIVGSVSDAFASAIAPVASDHTRGEGSEPAKEAETGRCISKPASEESPPFDLDQFPPLPENRVLPHTLGLNQDTRPIDGPAGDAAIQSRARRTRDASDDTELARLDPAGRRYGSNASLGHGRPGQSSVAGPSGTNFTEATTYMHASNTRLTPTDENNRTTQAFLYPEHAEAITRSDKRKGVYIAAPMPHPEPAAASTKSTESTSEVAAMLSRYPMAALRSLFPGKSDEAIRGQLGMGPGTPTPAEPYYGKEYASHAQRASSEAATDDSSSFVRARQSHDDPFTGDPDRSNLMYSASGRIVDARRSEEGGTYAEEISDLGEVVAASTPHRRAVAPAPAPAAAAAAAAAPSRAPPALPPTAAAAELMRQLDGLAAGHPEVSTMLRSLGYRGQATTSLGSGGSVAASSSAAGLFAVDGRAQGELLHQKDERARAEREERGRLRLEKKASKAALRSSKSVGGGEGGGGLFGRLRRGGGPSG